jgi:hypothetical protein
MRHSTAVRRLRAVAERTQRTCSLWEPGQGLVAVYTYGSVLDPVEEDRSVEVVQIALVINDPPERATWGARPPAYAGLPYVLELEKAPVDWCYRSASAPIGNHRVDRPLRIWSRESGVEEAALAALAAGDAEALREPRPRPPVLRRHLAEELATAAAHLREVRDRYWQRSWRGDHYSAGTYPENHLWDAVHGYLDLLDGVGAMPVAVSAELGGPDEVAPDDGLGHPVDLP